MAITLQGICYDAKSSFMRGPAEAPPLIRKAYHSEAANAYSENGTNTAALQVHDAGDFVIDQYEAIASHTMKHVEAGGKLLTLGGDHSITYPIMQAVSRYHPGVTILQIDAHGDLYDAFEGDPHSHACPFARIMEGGYAKRLVQAGIRTMTAHQWQQARKFGVEVVEMRHYNASNMPPLTGPLYISLDMDAFDPAFAPGISHHEPGGFSTRQVTDLLLSIQVPVIGADIVEYNPRRDIHDMTATLAAKMMKELLALMAR